MRYLEKLKAKISHPGELPKLPKDVEPENIPTPPTAKTAKSPFDGFDSTPGRRFSGNKPCPARCKRTGFCYGKAFFEGRADGKGRECTAPCPWGWNDAL